MPDIPVPPEAVTVAHDILWGGQMSEDLVRRALEVAAPYIRAGERERDAMPATAGVYTRPAVYDVTVWPQEMADSPESCMDADTWKVTVEKRGLGTWAVCRMGSCLGISGEWDREPTPSSRDDDWLEDHRFPLETALDLAREHAPKVRINGITATEIVERHRA